MIQIEAWQPFKLTMLLQPVSVSDPRSWAYVNTSPNPEIFITANLIFELYKN